MTDDEEVALVVVKLLERLDMNDTSFEEMYKSAWENESSKPKESFQTHGKRKVVYEAYKSNLVGTPSSLSARHADDKDTDKMRKKTSDSSKKVKTTHKNAAKKSNEPRIRVTALKPSDFTFPIPQSTKKATTLNLRSKVIEDQWMDSLCGQNGWYQTHIIDVIVNDARAAYQLAPIILRRGGHHEVLTCNWLWNRSFLGKAIWLLVTNDDDKYFNKVANPATEYMNDLIGTREPEKSTLWSDIAALKNVEMSVRWPHIVHTYFPRTSAVNKACFGCSEWSPAFDEQSPTTYKLCQF